MIDPARPADRLPTAWFQRDVLLVAPDLLGCILVHRRRAGVIVETEAYAGPEDLASHARFGRTPRTRFMYGPGGVAYVYLCYGIHEMFNIVTGVDGAGQAVLIRAIAPLRGLPDDPAIGRGPGKLTTALRIDRRLDGRSLARGALYVLPPLAPVPPSAIAQGPRIGVAFAGAWAERPWRYWLAGHPAVSGRPAARAATGATGAAPRRRGRGA